MTGTAEVTQVMTRDAKLAMLDERLQGNILKLREAAIQRGENLIDVPYKRQILNEKEVAEFADLFTCLPKDDTLLAEIDDALGRLGVQRQYIAASALTPQGRVVILCNRE